MKYILRPRYTHAELVRLAHEYGWYAYMYKIYHKHGTEIAVANDPNYHDSQQWTSPYKRYVVADEMAKLEAQSHE